MSAQQRPLAAGEAARAAAPRQVAMSWAVRLKRVFRIEIDRCARCAGRLDIIARIEQPAVIARILAHLERTSAPQSQFELPLGAWAPPVQPALEVAGKA